MENNMHSWEEYILTKVNPTDVDDFYNMMDKIYGVCTAHDVTDWDLEYCNEIIELLIKGGF